MEALLGVIWPQVKDWPTVTRSWLRQETDSPLEPVARLWSCNTLILFIWTTELCKSEFPLFELQLIHGNLL